jgi:two-component sensor histidine kinase
MTDVPRNPIPGTDGKPTPNAEERIGAEQRCEALTRLLDLFNNNEWCGANLHDIIAIELAGFGDRVELQGPQVVVRPPIVQSVALVVHQLATNAINFGALSTDQGRVRVAWHVHTTHEKEWLHFTWSEVPVAPPADKLSKSSSVECSIRTNPAVDPRSARSSDTLVCEFDVELCARGEHPR